MKYLVALVGIAFGMYVVVNSYATARLFGKLDYAEKYLGAGGTYAAWKLIGVFCIFASFAVLRWPSFFGL
ncbi:hypothetical protein BH11PAT4_BH11PAT4_7780 [soil metagenome]